MATKPAESATLEIGARINALRKSRGLSLAQLAKATGLSEATLSRIENEQSLVSAHHLTFIAWRAAAMDDDRWRRLTASHEFEAVLIKNLIENGRV